MLTLGEVAPLSLGQDAPEAAGGDGAALPRIGGGRLRGQEVPEVLVRRG